MSAAAGAPPPPPPPPPPPRKGSIASLPAELLLNIIRFLRTDDFASLALAIYPILQSHNIVPAMTLDIYHSIMTWVPRPGTYPWDWERELGIRRETGGSARASARSRPLLPLELIDMIMQYLGPTDRIAWLLSDQRNLWRYLPALSEADRERLLESVQDEEEEKGSRKKK